MKSSIAYLAVSLVIVTALAILGPWLNPYLDWNREALQQMQLWRLITGHLVHLNHWHAAMNLSALLAVMFIVGRGLKPLLWLLLFVILSLFTSVALYFFTPELTNYVGLSGVLHGIIAIGFLKTFSRSPWLSAIVLIYVGGRTIHQQLPGFDAEYLRSTIGGTVIVDAHLYGFIAGILLYIALLLWGKYKLSETKVHS